MKILHIGNIASCGLRLCQELRSTGIHADLLSKKYPLDNPCDKEWIFYYQNAWDEFHLKNINLNDYDLIHVHYLINWGSLGLGLRRPSKPIILHAHGDDARPRNPVEQCIQNYVLSQSKILLYSTPDLLSHLNSPQNEKIYMPNPVAVTPAPASTQKYKDRILIFTTLYKIKRLEAVFSLLGQMPFHFDILNIGPDRDYYHKIAPRCLNFLPALTKNKINETLLKYPLIIGGSQDGTIRMCELESMALGLPTLFPFRYNDFYPQALPMPEFSAASIQKHFGDYHLGQKQKDWVSQYHSSKIVAQKLLAIYKNKFFQTKS